ncbi:MAG: type I-MYXAN CRISPR-associated Cas8a1/Cmx1 [Chroococcidiopsidaceae cyanobacterium CP_BM_ER_R8_30]|nr:type I-MYXAN CRISPR-associated Cas8a1/Cmx1 [Chroococcidiopsidaceae cyanobacterium CP_BM_ER_R8_30]
MQKLTFHLSNPSYTLLHRAGLAGLWMTLQQLEKEGIKPQKGMQWDLSPCQVVLSWEGNDRKALEWLLSESFRLTDDGLILLRGLNPKAMRKDTLVILHQGILGTFLQHTSTHKSEGVKSEAIPFEGENLEEVEVSYKYLTGYVYQNFATNLCDKSGNLLHKPIAIAGWMNPGAVVRHIAFSADTSFEESPGNALILLFAPVACYYYTLKSRLRDKRAQYALVIPQVDNLASYAKYRSDINNSIKGYHDFYACSLGDAGLRFLTYETTEEVTFDANVSRCQVLTLGTVAWATQQRTRTDLYLVEAGQTICKNYRICRNELVDRWVIGKDGKFLVISFARELIAENLARSLPWYAGFADRVSSNELFQKLLYERGGLYQVIQKINSDEREKLFVRTCHEAIYYTYGQLAAKTRAGEEPNFDKVTVRIRTGLGRCKNSSALREFMTDFWSRAGKLPTLQKNWQDLMDFVMQEKDWKKPRDLALLALASYPGKEVMKQLLGEPEDNLSNLEPVLADEGESEDLLEMI